MCSVRSVSPPMPYMICRSKPSAALAPGLAAEAPNVSRMKAKYSNASQSKPRPCSARSMNAVSRIHV